MQTMLESLLTIMYFVCDSWSADSRLLVSGSKDSTMKMWDMKTLKLREDLPGHADEVFAVDWSPDGEKVASGGKDRVLKLWMS
jgi:ribosome assembly protein 4